jgi:hypothetical protein
MENEYYQRKLVDAWGKPNIHMGKPKVCAEKCGVEFDPFGAQFK